MTARSARLTLLPWVLSALVPPAFGQLAGTISATDIGGAVPGVAYLGIISTGAAGFSVSSAGDANGDGLADMLIGAPFAEPRGRINAGETYLLYGSASLAVNFDLAHADVMFRGINTPDASGFINGDHSGHSVSSAGDVNGDGLADLLIGAPYAASHGAFSAGESYLIYGRANLAGAISLAAANVTFRGIDPGGAAGYSVASAGDVNGDGLADILIGAPAAGEVVGVDAPGKAYLIYGSATLAGSFDLTAADVTFNGVGYQANAGSSVASAGDVNGDGLADLLIGASGARANGVNFAGATYLVFGSTSLAGSMGPGDADVTLRGINRFDNSGSSVSSAGDVNGDGYADLLIGAHSAERHGDSYVGEAYLVYGSAGIAGQIDLSAADVVFRGDEAYGALGASVASAGDVNDDGLADLLIRATEATYLVYGSESLAGSFDPANADVTFLGIASGEEAGRSVSSAGDVNGDGVADLLLGASARVRNGNYVGGAYLVYGQRVPEPASLALAGLAALGLSVASVDRLRGQRSPSFFKYRR